MLNLLNNRLFINTIHVIIVVPLLILLATDRFPQEYKNYLLIFALFVGVYHLCLIARQLSNEDRFEPMASTGKVHIVRILDSEPGYSIPILHVNLGDTVRWINIGNTQHTVTSNGDGFNSGLLKPGDIFEVTFTKVGTYNYFCLLNWGWMQGTVAVNN